MRSKCPRDGAPESRTSIGEWSNRRRGPPRQRLSDSLNDEKCVGESSRRRDPVEASGIFH